MPNRFASAKVGQQFDYKLPDGPTTRSLDADDGLAAPTGHQTAMPERKWSVIQHSEETMRAAHRMSCRAEIEVVDMNKYVSPWAKPSIAKWDRSEKKQYTVWDVLTACVVAVAFACAVFYSI